MTVVLFCGVISAQRLLDKFSEYMTDDLVIQIRRSQNDDDLSIPPQYLQAQLLQELSIMFSKNGYDKAKIRE